ncbi:dihydropyrimidinase [Sulfuracidifex tepidarius]|uniref:D-phenylhydantoinase n=1 Tax=Sulfuracidifex tepidarius TaxID=1294262 RepID=A0A510DXZ5_9CREN|nr:dihydropyrimidinase [Sulfuracidifex tepidarius]BBG25091.1 D-phenylhydantoinase [Sulfuracidifex tepidarius]BBG27873.1 D-phenylhydantoinase [Sulfuracidifex tepidarius]
MLDLVIKDAKVFTSSGYFEGDVGVKGGKIVKIGDVQEQADRTLDVQGKYVVPGLIDGHTHMEFPFMGEVTADDFYYGTSAAVGGGVTTIVDFVTPSKGQDLLSAYQKWRETADPKVVSDYGLHMIIREVNPTVMEQIPEVMGRGVMSFKLYMAYKGELMVNDGEILKLVREISSHGGVVGVHAENGEIINELVQEYVVEGKVDPIYHYYSRPDEMEIEAANRVASIASLVKGVTMYQVHTSTGEAVDVMSSYRSRGMSYFNETTPHYLTLTLEALKRPDGYKYVMSPPLRSDDQRTKLWQKLASGEIYTVGSDHCVYSVSQKRRHREEVPSFHEIPNGVPGTETILPLLFYFGVKKGKISMERFVEVTSTNPAKLFGLYPRKGVVQPGADADFAVIDPAKRVKITPDVLHSNIDYTIYDGIEVEGWNVMTIRRGEVVMEEGQITSPRGSGVYVPGKPVK